MVKADVIYKIKQNNGTVTKYKEEEIEADTYNNFLSDIEKNVRELKRKLGRHIRFDIKNFVREQNDVKSSDFTAKKAISFIKDKPKEGIEDFLSEDEDRSTVIRAYNKKLGIDQEKTDNKQ